MLWGHIVEQWKQTAILEQITCIQELDWEDWAFNGSEGLETGMEGSEEEEGMEESEVRDRKESKIDKGKGKEKADDGKDGNW